MGLKGPGERREFDGDWIGSVGCGGVVVGVGVMVGVMKGVAVQMVHLLPHAVSLSGVCCVL